MYVITNSKITDAATLMVRDGRAVLVLRAGLLAAADLALLQSLLACVSVTVDPAFAVAPPPGMGVA